MKLLGHTLHVAPLEQKQRSNGGIHLPQQYQDDRKRFRVLAVGQGRKLKDGTRAQMEVRPGDCILANLYRGQRHTFDDGSMIIDAAEAILVWNDEPLP
jgi:chaperonin GroES